MKKYLTLIRFMATALILLLGIIFIGSNKAHAAVSPLSVSVPPNSLECHWVDSSHIVCTTGGLLPDIVTKRTNVTKCEGWDLQDALFDYCGDLWFDAKVSKNAGYPVFQDPQSGDKDTHLSFTTNDPSRAAWFRRGDEASIFDWKAPPKDTPTNVTITKVINAAKAGTEGNCSIFVTSNCTGERNTGDVGAGPGLDTKLFRERVMLLIAQEEAFRTCNDEAPLGFILCPALDGVNDAIAGLIGGVDQSTDRHGLLINFLKVPSIVIGDPDQAIVKVVQNVVNIANIIYILIFLILIFSSSLPIGLDNYTIKKTLPKFIAAVILTQFSLVICSVVVDFFNLLGLAIPNLIFALAPGPPSAVGSDAYYQTANGVGGTMDAIKTNGATILGYVLLFIFAILALIAALTALIYLVIRYFVIYIMIILAPLAYVAWVLPGTEKFFSQWWKNFIRVNAMFLMIMGMLSISLVLANVFATIGTGTSKDKEVYGLIGALMPIIALLMVPKTLKWTTSAMNSLVSGAAGFATGKLSAGGKYAQGKAAQGAKATKEAGQNRIAESGFGNTRFGGMMAGAGMGSLINSKGAQNRLTAKQAKLRSERSAGVGVQYAKMRANGASAADIVKSVGGNKSSQFALMAQAAQSQDIDTVEALRASMGEKEWNEGVNANYAAFDAIPIHRQFRDADRIKEIQNLSHSGLVGMSAKAQEQIYNDRRGNLIPLSAFADAGDVPADRSKISRDLLIQAHARATAAPTTDATAQKLLNQLNADGTWQ